MTIELEDSELQEIFPEKLLQYMQKTQSMYRSLNIGRRIINIQGTWYTNSLEWAGVRLVENDRALTAEQLNKYLVHGEAEVDTGPPQISAQELSVVSAKLVEKLRGRFKLISAIRDVKQPTYPVRTTLVDTQIQTQLWTWDQSIGEIEQEKYSKVDFFFTRITDQRLDPAGGQLYIRRLRRIPFGLEGGGLQTTLNLLFSFQAESEKSLIFGIEEPESHCHFEFQRRLFDVLRELSSSNQIFIVTHSPVFVDRADLANTWLVKHDETQTVLQRVSELREILVEIGARPSDIFFFADKIVYVEGKSDEIVLRALAAKAGENIADVLIVPVEGKSKARLHLKTWIGITRQMLPILLILDQDAQGEVEELVKEGLIYPYQFHLWRRGSIESYYPVAQVLDAIKELNSQYGLEMDEKKTTNEVESGKLDPSKINLGEKARLLPRSFEVLLAERMASKIAEAKFEVPEEVESVLDRAFAIV